MVAPPQALHGVRGACRVVDGDVFGPVATNFMASIYAHSTPVVDFHACFNSGALFVLVSLYLKQRSHAV